MFTKITYSFILISTLAWGISPGFCAFKNRTYQDVISAKYKECKLIKENIFLKKDQLNNIEEKLGFKVSSLLLRYKNSCSKSFIYIDSHIVRTLNETVVIEVKDKRISYIEIASFMEPKEYLPPLKWIDLLKRKGSEVDSLTGATLSQNALKKLVQKYIVIDNILNDKT